MSQVEFSTGLGSAQFATNQCSMQLHKVALHKQGLAV